MGRIGFWGILGVLLVSAILAGCPPKDTDSDGLTDTEEFDLGTDPNLWDTDGDSFGDGDEVRSNRDPLVAQAVLADGAYVAESLPGLRIASFNGQTLVFDVVAESHAQLENGDVLISSSFEYTVASKAFGLNSLKKGFIGVVNRVREEAGQVLVEMGQAALTQALKLLDDSWKESVEIDSAELMPANGDLVANEAIKVATANGMVVVTSPRAPGLRVTAAPRVRFAGTVELTPSVRDAELQGMLAQAAGDLMLELDISVEAAAAFEYSTGDVEFLRAPIPMGGLPLAATFVLSGSFDLDFEGRLQAQAGYDSATSISLGARYVAASESIENLTNLFLEQNVHTPSLTIQAALGATLTLTPRIELGAYGYAGAYLQTAPYAQFQAYYPCPPMPGLAIGISGEAGIFAELFGFEWTRSIPYPAENDPPLRYEIWTADSCPFTSEPPVIYEGEPIDVGEGEVSFEGEPVGQDGYLSEDFEDGRADGWTRPSLTLPGHATSTGSFAVETSGNLGGQFIYAGASACTSPNIPWNTGFLEFGLMMPPLCCGDFNIVLALEDAENYVLIGLFPEGGDNGKDFIQVVRNGEETARVERDTTIPGEATLLVSVEKLPGEIRLYTTGLAEPYLRLVSGDIPQGPLPFYFRSWWNAAIDDVWLELHGG